MTRPTHNLQWHIEVTNVRGEVKRLSCSKNFDPTEWDAPREAALCFFFLDDREPLAKDGWHLVSPKTIQVWNVTRLSDAGW